MSPFCLCTFITTTTILLLLLLFFALVATRQSVILGTNSVYIKKTRRDKHVISKILELTCYFLRQLVLVFIFVVKGTLIN